MNSLLSRQTIAYNLEHKAEDITVSGPNWASICTGVHYNKHNVRENVFIDNDLESYPHFFQHLNNFYGADQVNLFSVAVWFPINYFMTLLVADYGPVRFDYTDQQAFDEASGILQGNHSLDPDVLFIHLDQLDHEGHSAGYHPDTIEYMQAVSNVDEYIEAFYNMVEVRKQENEEDWLIVIVSDHGGRGYGHNDGADDPEIRNTILILDNASVHATGVLNQSEQVDVVPTILNFLEVDLNAIDLDGQNLIN